MRNLFRFVPAAVAVLVLTACGSSGGSGNVAGAPVPIFGPGSQQCSPGTQVELANPAPYQTGVSPNLGSVTVVANGNSNALYSNYGQWQVVLDDGYGQQIYGNPLTLVDGHSDPHPFGSDFYYSSGLQGNYLQPGTTWNVGLYNVIQDCTFSLGEWFQT